MVRVVLGALMRDGRVLLGHRSPTKLVRPDVWDLPGGVVEAGESDLAALVRELDEELGVRVARESATLLCELTVELTTDPAVVTAWLVRDWAGTPANFAPEEHVDIGWVEIGALPPLVHPEVRSALVTAVAGHA